MLNTHSKLELLGDAARFDVCGYSPPGREEISPLSFIYRSTLPEGGCSSLFKVLLTNVCSNDCAYCVNQVGRDCRRMAFQPDELARTFMELNRKGLAKGMFLSSGIAGSPVAMQEKLVNTVEILRRKYAFRGYVHLKILPGADFASVEAACRLASRVSVNMEAPSAQRLAMLTSRKDILQGILEPMQWVQRITRDNPALVPSGQTTQFVVGAANETDRELLQTTAALYRDVGLRRAYFSAFRPISHSRIEDHPATPPMRQHRLYQVDWLLRVYGFSQSELETALSDDNNFALAKDPKITIARRRPWMFPLDINKASYDELLRVPGIGPVSARKIVENRKLQSIGSLQDLQKMRVSTRRAAAYIWFKGMLQSERQMSFLQDLDVSGESKKELAEVVA
jgi:predicted DNA-binding helix-hairpin-helix protein